MEQCAGPIRLEGDQGAYGGAGGGPGEVALRDVEALEVLGGEVDPVVAEVLGDVLEVLDDLEGGADLVGAADPLGVSVPVIARTSRPTGLAESAQYARRSS